MLRFLIGLLLGVIVGAGGTAYFFSTGGGDHLISTSPRVRHLEEDLRRVSQEREQIEKKLAETTARIEKMTAAFSDLERRLQKLENVGQKPEVKDSPEEGQSEVGGPPS